MTQPSLPSVRMTGTSPRFSQGDGLRLAGIGLAYFFAHQIAFLFPNSGRVLAAVWPAGG
jgi:hypothetical protein